MPTAHHLRLPTSGPERVATIDKLALGLFRKLGPSACLLLASRLEEVATEEPPDAAPQEPVERRAAPDGPRHGPSRDRRPTPAAGRPQPHS